MKKYKNNRIIFFLENIKLNVIVKIDRIEIYLIK